MQRIVLIALLVLHAQCAFTQSTLNDVSLGITQPAATGAFSDVQVSNLESKIIQILHNSGMTAVGYYNDFVVCPSISVEESAAAEGGLQNVFVTTLNLSLVVKQMSTSAVFGSTSRKVKGSGNSMELAITNAISNMNVSSEAYSQFIETAENKISKYYNDNCAAIINSAGTLEAKRDYEGTMAVLESIPSSAHCYKEAQDKIRKAFVKYQKAYCSKILTSARADIALKNYSKAMETLELVDPTSACIKEKNELISQVSGKMAMEEKREYNLDVLRINAVKEIAKAYFSQRVVLLR
jgi:hypothetical protein